MIVLKFHITIHFFVTSLDKSSSVNFTDGYSKTQRENISFLQISLQVLDQQKVSLTNQPTYNDPINM